MVDEADTKKIIKYKLIENKLTYYDLIYTSVILMTMMLTVGGIIVLELTDKFSILFCLAALTMLVAVVLSMKEVEQALKYHKEYIK